MSKYRVTAAVIKYKKNFNKAIKSQTLESVCKLGKRTVTSVLKNNSPKTHKVKTNFQPENKYTKFTRQHKKDIGRHNTKTEARKHLTR